MWRLSSRRPRARALWTRLKPTSRQRLGMRSQGRLQHEVVASKNLGQRLEEKFGETQDMAKASTLLA